VLNFSLSNKQETVCRHFVALPIAPETYFKPAEGPEFGIQWLALLLLIPMWPSRTQDIG
jgi:hypothetical protein